MRNNISKSIKKYWLLFFFIFVFLFMAIFKISPRDIWIALSSLKPSQLVLLLSIYLLISLSQIITRKYLLYSLASPAKFKNLILIHFLSMAAHYSTPAKVGFPVAVYLLKTFDKVPYAIGTTMILIELVVSTTVCGIFAFMGTFFYFRGKTHILLVSFSYLFVFGLLGLCGMYVFLRRGKKDSRIYQFVKKMGEAFYHIAFSHLALYTFLVILIQFLAGFSLVLLSGFFSEELSLWQAVIANSAAFFLGALSMIPMGLGVREGSILFYLRHLGIAHEIGISIVTIQRLFSTGLSFVLGLIFGTVLGMRNINQDSI